MSYEPSAVHREASAVACANNIKLNSHMVYYNGVWVLPPIIPDISRHAFPTESIEKLDFNAKFPNPAKILDWKKREFRNLDIRPIIRSKAAGSPLKKRSAYEEDFAAYKQSSSSSSSSSSETTSTSRISHQSADSIEPVLAPVILYPEPAKARSRSMVKSILKTTPKSVVDRPSRIRKRPSRYRSPQPHELFAFPS